MSGVTIAAVIVAGWFAASVVTGLLVGKFIAAGSRRRTDDQ